MTNFLQSFGFFALVLTVMLLLVPSASAQLHSIEVDRHSGSSSITETYPNVFANENTTIANDANAEGWVGWSVLIALLVLATGASVAYLCYQSILAWEGAWKLMAMAPLVVIAFWLTFILVSKLSDPDSHQLWAFEVFSWAMATTLYLVILMTAKRAYLKAEQEKDS